jgi:hypothetical protein
MPRRSGVVEVAPSTAMISLPGTTAFTQPLKRGQYVGPTLIANHDAGNAPQNETAIAISTNAPWSLVASANDYRNGDSNCGTYTSTDAGQSWRDLGAGVLPQPQPTGGDPTVAFDRNRAAYFVCLGFNRLTNASGLYVGRTTDFQSITMLTPVIQDPDNSPFFNDKEYMTIDTRPSSPYADRIYVSWTRFGPSSAPIVLASSSDGGRTWSAPVAVTPPDLNFNQGSVPRVGPKGELYVAFENFNTGPSQVMVAKSTDGGQTFARPVKVADDFDISLPNTSFRMNSFPSLDVDGLTGAAYVVWADQRSGTADILVSRSTDGAQTWSAASRVNDVAANDQFAPWVAVGGDHAVQVVYYDRRDDPANVVFHAYLSTSRGSGGFQPGVRVSQFPVDPNAQFGGGFIGDYIGIAAGPLTIHPSWMATQRAAGSTPQQDAATAVVINK